MKREVQAAFFCVALAVVAHAQQADLSLTKTVDGLTVAPGATLGYTLTVENLGPDTAVSATVVDRLSPHAVFSSASAGCSYDDVGHRVICVVGDLGPGMSRAVEIDVVADVPSAEAEVGVAVSGQAAGARGPATALVVTRTDDHGLITVDDRLVSPRGIVGESGGTLLVADQQDPSASSGGDPVIDGRIIRIDRTGASQEVLSEGRELVNPTGIAIDDAGRIFIADPQGPVLPDQLGRVIEVDPVDGSQTVLASGTFLEEPRGVAVLASGDLAVADGVGRVVLIDPATGVQALVTEFDHLGRPMAVAELEPGVIVVADLSGGLVRVELAEGAQTVLRAIDWVDLCEPLDVDVDHDGRCWVADFSCGGSGVLLQIDCEDGSILASFIRAEVWASPTGLELLDVVSNSATVSSSTTDPDLSNNHGWTATVIEEGYVPPVEVSLSETVSVADNVLVDVITAVIIEVLEAVTVTDTVTPLPALLINVSETIVVYDAVTARPALILDLAELVHVGDAVDAQPLLPLQVLVTETINVDDLVVALPSVVVNLAEAVLVTDLIDVSPLQPVEIDVSESIGVSDQVTALPAVVVTVSEGVLVADAVTVSPQQPVEINVVEAVAVSDHVSVTPAAAIFVAEQITVTDAPLVTVQSIVTIEVHETVAVTDQVALLVETPIFVDGFESSDTSAWSSATGGG